MMHSPHMRGANHNDKNRVFGQFLSSPRARGKRRGTASESAVDPSIPARAGQTLLRPSATSFPTFHPHVRGANLTPASTSFLLLTLCHVPRHECSQRLAPSAIAGVAHA